MRRVERKERARREDQGAKQEDEGGGKVKAGNKTREEYMRGQKTRRNVRKRGKGVRRGGRNESRRVEWRRGEMMPWRARGGDLGAWMLV